MVQGFCNDWFNAFFPLINLKDSGVGIIGLHAFSVKQRSELKGVFLTRELTASEPDKLMSIDPDDVVHNVFLVRLCFS
jgi:hypothetical protein